MDEVFDYQIVEADSHATLTDRVKTLIDAGWQPIPRIILEAA